MREMRNLGAWSGLSFNPFNLFFFLASCFCMLPYSTSNVLSPGDSLRTWQILTSANGEFALGFFIPGNSNNRYVGIWYNKLKTPTQTIVWVANRDDPLTSSSGKFTLTIDGNLAILDGSGKIVWQRNDWTASRRLGMLNGELLDSGNLVLRDRSGIVWQSFDYPTDTLLPGMRIRKPIGTPNDIILSTWEKGEDPGSRSFSFCLNLVQKNELFIKLESKRYWQSGVWNGKHFEDMEYLSNSGLLQFDFNSNSEEKLLMYSSLYNITRLVMDFSGQLQFFMWNDLMEDWSLIWFTTWDCTAACGPNSMCNNKNPSICKCLPGFKPLFSTKWNSGIWSHGCRRKTGLDCRRDNGFKILSRFSISSVNKEGTEYQSAEQCNATCRDNCNCSAWSYSGTSRRGLQEQRRLIDYSQINRSGPGSTNIGGRSSGSNESVNCWIWEGNLLNVSEGAEDGGIDLYLRIPASESGNKYRRTAANKALNVIIMVTAIIGMAFLGTFIYCLWRLRVKKKGN